MDGANANGFDARDAQLTETVFSPNGTVHTVDLRSPGGILYGALLRRTRLPAASLRCRCACSRASRRVYAQRCACAALARATATRLRTPLDGARS
jgi:hypothetical protein